jgi:tRNA nucleotidyltransferase/poly(A) polymerase
VEIHAVNTWYDKKLGVVQVEDDVANVVRDIREIDPRIHVYWNEQGGEFDLVETCLDGTERLIFSVNSLDARVVTRLKQADQWHGREDPAHLLSANEDFLTQIDADEAAETAKKKAANREKIHEVGEMLAWAGEQDRRGVGAQILVPKDPDA